MQSETLSDEGRAARRRMRGDVCGDGGGLGLAPLLVLPRGDATAAALLPFRSVPLSLSPMRSACSTCSSGAGRGGGLYVSPFCRQHAKPDGAEPLPPLTLRTGQSR